MTDGAANEYSDQWPVNMRQLEAIGYKPFGSAFQRTGRLADIAAGFENGLVAPRTRDAACWRYGRNIDRLTMVLAGAEAIMDVSLFPLLRTKSG